MDIIFGVFGVCFVAGVNGLNRRVGLFVVEGMFVEILKGVEFFSRVDGCVLLVGFWFISL